MSPLRIAGVAPESTVDGPGFRYVLYVQGCPHRCRGCHNPGTWPFDGGYDSDPAEHLAALLANPLLAGLTLSGGEPFCQAAPLADLAAAAHAVGRTVVTYTGYTYERLTAPGGGIRAARALLGHTDLLIDGPYRAELSAGAGPFRGSTNQRLVDVPMSLALGRVVCLLDEERREPGR